MSERAAIAIRPATITDLPTIAVLWEELTEFHCRLETRPLWQMADDGADKFREWMEEALDDANRALFVAEASSQVVGFVHGMLREAPPVMKPRRSGFVTDFFIADSHRRSGLGRQLLQTIEDWCQSRGAVEITLHAAVRNRGQRLISVLQGDTCPVAVT